MLKRIKYAFFISAAVLTLATAGCKKGTFDINNVNPNVPSSVSPQFVLSAALVASASDVRGGDADFAELYMGYWAFSGDYIPTFTTATYQTTTGDYTGNWNNGYLILKNYQQIIDLSGTDPNNDYYVAMAKIMKAYHYQRLVDMYNDLPYSDALAGGTQDFPAYDAAAGVYTSLVHQLDSAITLINGAPVTANNPNGYDVMFGGNMTEWVQFANTIKLRLLLNTTAQSSWASTISTELTGKTSADFLGVGQDASVNPGYSNSSEAQQSPFYYDMGFSTSGAVQNNESYYRACAYTANFLKATNDPRQLLNFAPASASDTVKGRVFGSITSVGEDNQHISAMNTGLLGTASSPAVIIPACESLFMQAEAAERGYISGSPSSLYQSAVTESYRLLGDDSATRDATAYTAQADSRVNWSLAAGQQAQINLIVLQEWIALTGIDPVTSWSNWRRLGIPSNLPVSIYPGTIATHVPYRLLYPTTEYSYNQANVNKEGTINNITSKIFWMP